MSKLYLKLVVVLLFLLCCLSACKKQNNDSSMGGQTGQMGAGDSSGDIVSDLEGTGVVNNNSHINQKLSSGIGINADVDILDSVDIDMLTEFKAKLVVQDYEKAKELFLSNKEIVEEINENIAESMTNSPYKYCQTSDNYSLSSTGADLWFGGELASKINYIFTDSGDQRNSDKFLTGGELDFQSIEKAQEEVEDIIGKLGIFVAQKPICYTMDYETLYSECKGINESMTENIDEIDNEKESQEAVAVENKDECYLFVYKVLADSMPVSSHENGVYGDGSYTSGTIVRCIYSAEGIVQFSIEYQFQVTMIDSEGEKGLDVEQALQLLDQKYNSIILEGEYFVDSIEFEYVPMPENGTSSSYILVPAWRFSVGHTYEVEEKENSSETMMVTQRSSVVFHAITGEEILIDSGSD